MSALVFSTLTWGGGGWANSKIELMILAFLPEEKKGSVSWESGVPEVVIMLTIRRGRCMNPRKVPEFLLIAC